MSYFENANPGTKLVHTAYKLDRMGVRNRWLPHNREPQFPSEFAAHTANALVQCLLNAEKARQHADSYRQFLVGAAAVAFFYGLQGSRTLELYHGANVKPLEGSDVINVHAEQMIMANISAARQPDESVYVPLLAVIGDLQPDQQTGRESLTLPPCGVCRDASMQPDTPVDERTLFVTMNPTLTAAEWFSLRALAKISKGEPADSGMATFSERPLVLTQPDLSLTPRQREAEADSPEMVRSEREFDQKMKFPIMAYVNSMMEAELLGDR